MDTIITFACAGAAITLLISKSQVFAWLRNAAGAREGWAWEVFHDLITCYFCLSFWVAFAFQALYAPHFVGSGSPLDQVVTWLAITGAIIFVSAAIVWLKKTAEKQED